MIYGMIDIEKFMDEIRKMKYSVIAFIPDKNPASLAGTLGGISYDLGRPIEGSLGIGITHTSWIDFKEYGRPLDGEGHIISTNRNDPRLPVVMLLENDSLTLV